MPGQPAAEVSPAVVLSSGRVYFQGGTFRWPARCQILRRAPRIKGYAGWCRSWLTSCARCRRHRMRGGRGADAAGRERRVVDPRGLALAPAGLGRHARRTEGRHDPALQELGARSLSRYDALVARLRADGYGVRYSRNGSIELALDENAADALAQESAALTRDGVAHTLSDGEQSRERTPGLAPAIATLEIPAHGAVNVPEIVEAMWLSAERKGARLTMRRARAMRRVGTVRVETTTGPRCAARRSRRGMLGGADRSGWCAAASRASRRDSSSARSRSRAGRAGAMGAAVISCPGTTARCSSARRWGAGFEEQATLRRRGVAAPRGAAPAARSRAGDVRRRARWPQARHADNRPIIGGRPIDGLVYATGHYRNGALLAPITAELVADLVEGRALDSALAPYAPSRFGEY